VTAFKLYDLTFSSSLQPPAAIVWGLLFAGGCNETLPVPVLLEVGPSAFVLARDLNKTLWLYPDLDEELAVDMPYHQEQVTLMLGGGVSFIFYFRTQHDLFDQENRCVQRLSVGLSNLVHGDFLALKIDAQGHAVDLCERDKGLVEHSALQ
jgi:hypothetical protein